MKRTSDKTRKIIYWTMFGCSALSLIAVFIIVLVGLKESDSSLILLLNILLLCNLIVNVINVIAFKPNGRKSGKSDKEGNGDETNDRKERKDD